MSAGAYPKIFYNVNLAPVVARNASQHAALGGAGRLHDAPIPAVPAGSLNPENASQLAPAGTGSFHCTITGYGQTQIWTAEVEPDAASWLTIDSPTSQQTADGDVKYSFPVNPGQARAGNINVNGKLFFVVQQMGA